ncbi:MAG: NTP transferase domain-containing protein [Deltaproteobacteria bacterium]|nr:NTP transferase domain-containing protein [Deltaproteobacteria bacterium]
MPPSVRKAVIPMAGKGTRFRPITHVVPKEFLPILNRPLIDYVVQEAVSAGCEEIICVTAPGRELIRDYWPHTAFAAHRLTIVHQTEALGLGHAVGCAAAAVGNEPFFVLLPDIIIDAPTSVCTQLAQASASTQGRPVIAVRPEPTERLASLGVVAVDASPTPLLPIRDLVEKPAPGTAPSNLTIVGRYLLPPTIFDDLRHATPGAIGEIQLTDALRTVAQREGLSALQYSETATFDCGTPSGWLAANQYFGKPRG